VSLIVKCQPHRDVSELSSVCLVFCILGLVDLRNVLAVDASASFVRPIQTTEKPGNLILTIEASRPQLYAGSGFGLTAQIKNASGKPVVLEPTKTILSMPPELQGPRSRWDTAYYAFFPTETWSTENAKPAEAYRAVLVLLPDDTYAVKWAWDARQQTIKSSKSGEDSRGFQSSNILEAISSVLETVYSELQFMFFPPGDYKVDVVVRYKAQEDPPDKYQAVVQSAIVHVNAPQTVILVAAAIGGLLGHVISRIFLRGDGRLNGNARLAGFAGWFGGAAGSMLLAVIVTILLARISESQFLFRVSVNDFWGAIAIGFIASVTGIRILQNVLPSGGVEPRATSDKANDRVPIPQPTFEQIRQRAYAISERRRKSGDPGNETTDWLQAESELKRKPTVASENEAAGPKKGFLFKNLFREKPLDGLPSAGLERKETVSAAAAPADKEAN
jgi:hypothetical protein